MIYSTLAACIDYVEDQLCVLVYTMGFQIHVGHIALISCVKVLFLSRRSGGGRSCPDIGKPEEINI